MKLNPWLLICVALLSGGCTIGPISFNPTGSTPVASPAATQRPATTPASPVAGAASPVAGSPAPGTPAAGSPTVVRTGTVVASPVVTRTVVTTATVRATGTVTTATATRTPTGTVTAGDPQNPIDVTVSYVLQRTSIRGFDVSLDALTADWARATVRPKAAGEAPSVAYLKKQPAGWSVVSFGPAQPSDARGLGIPDSIIGQASPPSSGTPQATGTPGR